jgi:hypothetical protein
MLIVAYCIKQGFWGVRTVSTNYYPPSVRSSVHLYFRMDQRGFRQQDFHELYNWGFKKICQYILILVKIRRKESRTI